MPSIDETAGIEEPAKLAGEPIEPEAEVIEQGGGFRIPEWLSIPRLDEPIETYRNHPLNFSNSEGIAYVIRGFSALAGGVLNYWWMDVLGGFMRMRKERSQAEGVGHLSTGRAEGEGE